MTWLLAASVAAAVTAFLILMLAVALHWPLAARSARALPEPRTINNFYGVTPEQIADAIARQQRAIEGR